MCRNTITESEAYRVNDHELRDISSDMADEMIAHLDRDTNYFGRGYGLFASLRLQLMQFHIRQATGGKPFAPYDERKAMDWASARVQTIQRIGKCIVPAEIG